jgi:uncharacterized membrane-anchored protein YhcB (DUF1043 family)
VYIDTDISAKLNKPVKRKIYIWKKANKEKLEDQASEMVKHFQEKINKLKKFIVQRYRILVTSNSHRV